jgi:hypothetical protein
VVDALCSIVEGTTMKRTRVSADVPPSSRPYITSGVAAASAGILAASLVAVPPEVVPAMAEVRAVHLAALDLAQVAAAIFEKAGGEPSSVAVTVASGVQRNAGSAPSITAGQNVGLTGAARQAITSEIDSPQFSAAAVPAPTADSILGGLLVGAFFFIVIPAFWVVIVVTSVINVVLGAVGLPLLPNVPYPPLGPVPLAAATVAPEAELGRPTADPPASQVTESEPQPTASVAPKTRKAGSPTDMATDTTSKPLTKVSRDSADFTPKRPKRHDDENSSADGDSATTQQDATADAPSIVGRPAPRHAEQTPKHDTTDGDRESAADSSEESHE